MFDVSSSEFLLVMVIALVVIGPKDLPKVLRFVGKWVGKARAVAAQFRSGLDDMVRQSELEELEKKWKSENERIMAQAPATSNNEANNGDIAGTVTAPAEQDQTDQTPPAKTA
jgi:sec-independent protein translocase protein TatB